MDIKKYYKPEPDEFCIGSIYYMPIADENGNETGEYCLIKIDEYLHYTYAFGHYWDDNDGTEIISVPENALMKYLDKEDIESCGFVYEEACSWDDYYSFFNGKNHRVFLSSNSQNIFIIEYGIPIMTNDQFFNGTIKNLCEFKKLLKQLGI